LAAIGLQSIYHRKTGEAQGQESTPTFFLQRNIEKAYHIDYVFTSCDLQSPANLEIGDLEHWLNVSDHMPVVLKIQTPS
jgi:exodeoxyribonuclease-3